MDIKQRGLWLARQIPRVLWFIVRNPFLILKRLVRWSLVLLFWLFVLGWGISVFAAEWTPATFKYVLNPSAIGSCTISNGANYGNISMSECASKGSVSWTSNGCTVTGTTTKTYYCTWNASGFAYQLRWGAPYTTSGSEKYVCPPDGKPTFTVGPKTLNGQQVCEVPPVSCKVGEQLFMNSTTGAESCKENCASVAGQVLTGVAYNKAFLPSATVTCYGLCSVTSKGTTIEVPADGFTQHGDIQFTGEKCPVTFPDQGTGQPVYNDQPTSSQQTNNAQNQLQNAANGATSNPVPGATGTADLNAVVNKLAETSNAQIKAMSEQNAAMGKVVEGVGKDIQGAIREGNANNGGGGAGNSVGQMQTANAIKEGNQTLKEIKDKLDEQQNPEPPVSPGTNLDADAKSIHEANDWGQRNFGTVLTANATRFRALPIFALPTTFFTVNLGGNACPTYTGSFTVMGSTQTVTLDAFCSSTVMNVMPFIRAVVMMVFGWLAWRIAIGNGG
ncbi:TPA: hypothetical protein ACGD2I_000120 [Aeromonas hydrophila]|uniref:hypothetical protein n=1 Tax=Aeromonas hydrophila TaxID=644 RepID=UPI0021E82534|nr:hypothetical protein [Aeromonas hydrophila]MCV3295454.1 hypothetical protein [Aeromonas hydrophila]